MGQSYFPWTVWSTHSIFLAVGSCHLFFISVRVTFLFSSRDGKCNVPLGCYDRCVLPYCCSFSLFFFFLRVWQLLFFTRFIMWCPVGRITVTGMIDLFFLVYRSFLSLILSTEMRHVSESLGSLHDGFQRLHRLSSRVFIFFFFFIRATFNCYKDY